MGIFQIKAYGLFAGVAVGIIATAIDSRLPACARVHEADHVHPSSRFHFDYLCPMVGKSFGHKRARTYPSEIGYSDSFKRKSFSHYLSLHALLMIYKILDAQVFRGIFHK
jgi:hypothetical protein